MPPVWRDLPSFVQGLHSRNRDLTTHVQRAEKELAELRARIAVLETRVANAPRETVATPMQQAHSATNESSASPQQDPVSMPPRIASADLPRRTVHVWHTEGLGLSGILSWMWRLRDHFAPAVNLDLRLVDLAVLPYGFQQAGADPSTFYDERIATSQQFLAFLQRTANDVHVVNHAFSYLTSLMEQLGPDLLRGLRLVGVCHTDQEYYYANLEKLAPVLRRIIAVSPTCAATLAARIPQYQSKIVTLPAWAVQLPSRTAAVRSAHEPLRLLYTGRILHFQKRVFDLVELATRLRAGKVNATLTIVGDGPDREELEQRFSKAGSRSIPVTFEPIRPPWEMDTLLATHHAFVQVSEFEGASVSLMEALANGLVPAVTVTRSGHDLLESDVNALTAPVGDMKRLAALIALLARDRARHERLAAAARSTAESYLADLAYPERFASLMHAVAA
jgi:glycosyltransferase involved in cell wall biosynthesis